MFKPKNQRGPFSTFNMIDKLIKDEDPDAEKEHWLETSDLQLVSFLNGQYIYASSFCREKSRRVGYVIFVKNSYKVNILSLSDYMDESIVEISGIEIKILEKIT